MKVKRQIFLRVVAALFGARAAVVERCKNHVKLVDYDYYVRFGRCLNSCSFIDFELAATCWR